jgi:uncharacterized 2Fe-2S/4Fe-4S cluster protein (DUF4445 family)
MNICFIIAIFVYNKMAAHKEIKITLQPIGLEIPVQAGTPLMDILHEYGIEFPCGGKGTCGSCRFRLISGTIPVTSSHASLLADIGLPEDMRLACMSAPYSDITIEIPQLETVILADNTRFEFEPHQGFGIAVDLGTTTLVAQLLDLSTGQVVNVVTARNPQGKYGSDIMSRIEFALHEGGAEILKQIIRDRIRDMISTLLSGHTAGINKIILVGNTVMHHLFCGINVKPLSYYPFESPNTGIRKFSPSDLGWSLDNSPEISFMPSIGSFVGSDILAGIFATRLHLGNNYQVLIDLGTNGEIVVGNRERIICASTAAGPAFEGARINMGMTASTGAISSVKSSNGKFSCHTIGNIRSTGICGSGIIDAISVFLDKKLINDFGDIQSDKKEIFLDSNVFLNQKDIREVQLAKSAVASGLEILYRQLNIAADNIENLYIAGGFGNFINLANSRRIGLLDHPEERIRKMGNTALIGAKIFLFTGYDRIDEVLKITKHISLESDPEFQELFINNMMFREK